MNADQLLKTAQKEVGRLTVPKHAPGYFPLAKDVEIEARIELEQRRQIVDCIKSLQAQRVKDVRVRDRTDVMFSDPATLKQYSITTTATKESNGVRSKTHGQRIHHDGLSILVRTEIPLKHKQEDYRDTLLNALRLERLGIINKRCVDVIFFTRDEVYSVTFSFVTDEETSEQLCQMELELKGLLDPATKKQQGLLTPSTLVTDFHETFCDVFGIDGMKRQDQRTKFSWLAKLRHNKNCKADAPTIPLQKSNLLRAVCRM